MEANSIAALWQSGALPISSALANDDRQPVDPSERSKWLPFFADSNLASVEFDTLSVEGDQLLKAITKVFPSEARDAWTFKDFEDAVKESRKNWESKDRVAGGKVQKHFHNLMGKFGAHSNLFQIIPQGDRYLSLLTGGATVLVKASVNHLRTSQELNEALEVINEAATRCDVEHELIRSQAMAQAIAKLYVAIFLFLTDAMLWYKSSSRAKFLNSLQDNFSEKFKSAVEKVTTLSMAARRIADMGTAAEVRVVRFDIEELRVELQDARVGLRGELRMLAEMSYRQHEENLEQHDQTQRMLSLRQESTVKQILSQLRNSWQSAELISPGTRGLLDSRPEPNEATSLIHPSQPFREVKPLQPMPIESSEGKDEMNTELPRTDANKLRNRDLKVLLGGLLEHGHQSYSGAIFPDETASPDMHTESVAVPLNHWLSTSSSSILYMECSGSNPLINPLTFATCRIIQSAQSSNIPLISFSSELPSTDSQKGNQKCRVDGMLAMIYSLVYQIFAQLPPLNELEPSFERDMIRQMDQNLQSWTFAIDLLEKSLAIAPPVLLCIIDGFTMLSADEPFQVRNFVRVLRNAVHTKEKVLKALFITRFRIFNLVSELSTDEVVLVNEMGPGKSPRRSGPRIPIQF